jgi:L-fucono-1,5-lactonase
MGPGRQAAAVARAARARTAAAAFTEADLRPEAAAAGVTATVVVQTVTDTAETAELLELAAASGLVTGVVGWVGLEDPAVADRLAVLRGRPDGRLLCGIRHPLLVEPDPRWLARPAVLHGLRAIGQAGLCYDLVLPAQVLPAAVEAAAACPGLMFVLDHLGNPEIAARPDERWVAAVRQLAALPNTACKLSGILGEPPPGGRPATARPAAATPPDVKHLVPYFDTVLEAFGPGRLMFGSDWPVCTLTASYQAVIAAARALTAGLGEHERAEIFGGTARRVYRLT